MWLERLRSMRRAHPWETGACLLWIVIGVALLMRGGLQPNRANTYHYYLDAGWHWRTSQELYQAIGETCRYSPLVHALVVPLTAMPDWLGATCWRLVNNGVFLIGLFWWAHVVLPRDWTDRSRGLVLLSTIPMAIGSMDNAQSNPLMTGSMLIGITTVALGRWNLAACSLAIACFLKIYPIALVLLLILLYPRQLTGRFLGFAAAGLLLPFVMQDPTYVARQYGNWLTNLEVDDRSQIALERAYRDLWLLVRVGHLPVSVTAYKAIQLAGAALAATLVFVLRWRGVAKSARLNLALGLAACWMTLLGPATESATYIVLAPTMGWALAEGWNSPRSLAFRGLVIASFGMFLAARLAGLLPGATAQVHALGPHPLGALLLMVALGSACLMTRSTQKGKLVEKVHSSRQAA